MAKQIKLGFDKIPAPKTASLEPLLDVVSGSPLFNNRREPLFTEVESIIPTFIRSRNSTSLHVNNDDSVPAPVIEQFSESSQVSSSLLGIPRSETQLSLFADVSTYGLDDSIWEITTSPSPFQPVEWATRKNPVYGSRFYQKSIEISNEQAIALTAFPTPWTYPFGPQFAEIGLYNKNLYERYKDFIDLGNQLYDFYIARGDIDFAQEHFLSQDFASIVEDDVSYNETSYSIEQIFAEIEKWTLSWMKIRDSQLGDPDRNLVQFLPGFDSTNTSPGYSSSGNYYVQLESRRVFRYQPGRISGFTFGIRCSTDPGSFQNIIEWGCANETDEYMFQVKGSQFNIIRRSTVPLPEENLRNMFLTPQDQILKTPVNPWRTLEPVSGVPSELYELVIPRDKFSGDPLNGNGPSGYIISFEEVTMYKIEFSWYGAIGAKFYAYIPSGNGEARWVLIHTIVIENQLGQPCLRDPFFKFRYTLAISNTSNLVAPQFIYKYGASYYIDGGDQGTLTANSYQSDIVSSSVLETRSLMGILPKDFISNSEGDNNINRKIIIPESLSASASKAARIDIIECEGCPGFAHHYAPGLKNGTRNMVGTLFINGNGVTAEFEPENEELDLYDYMYESTDLFTKIIADGLYSSYLYVINENTLGIARRMANSQSNNSPDKSRNYSETPVVVKSNGEEIPVKGQSFPARLTKFADIAVADVELTKKTVKVNFLNPVRNDAEFGRHFADFFIGITNKVPSIDDTTGNIFFDNQPLDLEDLLYLEYAPYSAGKNRKGYDTTEEERRIGRVFELGSRLRNPPGVDSGRCSTFTANVNEFRVLCSYSSTNPTNENLSGNFLLFNSAILNNIRNLQGGEIGLIPQNKLIAEGTGINFVDERLISYRDPATNIQKYYINISGQLPEDLVEIYVRSVSATGRYVNNSKAFLWNLYPLYIVIGMRDYAEVRNITIEESDELSKFTYTPSWLLSEDTKITVINSGIDQERYNSSAGTFESGGRSAETIPPTNFLEKNRLDSALIDNQSQQPLRPGTIKASFFLGDNETGEIDLTDIFGEDRTIITPGRYNTKATFFTVKGIKENGEVQISINTKEQ